MEDPFRVIVIGAGPVGLMACHALSSAGIDHVLLEKRPKLDKEAGTSIAMWPHNVRVLDQLGLLDEALDLYMPVLNKINLRRDGTVTSRNDMFAAVQRNHGHDWMCFHRARLMDLLYRRLPENSENVLFDKKVVAIDETTPDCVTVICEDGSSYTGSMVLGADGVHSTVRRLMNKNVGGDSEVEKEDSCFKASYRGLYGYSARFPQLEPSTIYETHGKRFSIQLVVAEKQQHFIIYQKSDYPTSKMGQRFTQVHRDAMAAEFADVKFAEGVTFGDVWASSHWSNMSLIEEGTVSRWHHGRVVLVGDAVHKMTPNSGFGMNSGVQGVVSLVNGLYGLLNEHKEMVPGSEELQRVFTDYHSARLRATREAVQICGIYTRVVAWDNIILRMADQHILPLIGGDVTTLNLLMSPIVQRGVVLSFLEEKNFRQGTKGYKTPRQEINLDEKATLVAEI
ncbi:hypothetical protein PgNI_05400 [Pyricularia grisea]|uniref:FAD-binding domain-containing protein n=1 Tax=Pyricularia grisea TaxID=148305 RepID=A0A6P8B6C5_PYRGI|nr:hypothetical protein PgNI_05400 [Pyricularia grisea]TLD10803.1 hypothetical protein PgNI_05400 [Pyricularia grisea]